MLAIRRVGWIFVALVMLHANAMGACAPLGKSGVELDALKASKWVIASDTDRNALAIALADCLGDPDPSMRDGIAFEALQHFMRGGQLATDTLHKLSQKLSKLLTSDDPLGFQRPFAVLVLAEVVRADRIKPFMTPSQRSGLLNISISYMLSITDYRAFDPREGYRHAVAHAADLLMQLAFNPASDTKALSQIRHAIGVQAGTTATTYGAGEGERLARAILVMANRKAFNEAEWTSWFVQMAGPGELKTWDGWHVSLKGIARRHNLTSFLSAVYINANVSSDPDLVPLRAGVLEALKALP